MNRREAITLFGGAVAWPVAARGQQRLWRIGQVRAGSEDTIRSSAAVIEQRLHELGHVPGRDILLDNRFVSPIPEAMERAIQELLPNIDLLVVWGTIGGVAAKNLVSDLPIVFVSVAAPVEFGMIQSLARPGGNMTGISFEAAAETYGKRLQLLKETAPAIKRVAVLGGQGDANVSFATASLSIAAGKMGVTLIPIEIRTPDDLAAAFENMRRNEVDGLIVVAGNLTSVTGVRLAELAVAHNLPSCYAFKEIVAAGGLISLGPDRVWMARQTAEYIDKIIRGAKPADLPVQQPVRYEIHLNLKTAKALGLTVPATLLAIADEVIE